MFDAMTRRYHCHTIHSKTISNDDNKLSYINVMQNVRGGSVARRALARQHNYDTNKQFPPRPIGERRRLSLVPTNFSFIDRLPCKIWLICVKWDEHGRVCDDTGSPTMTGIFVWPIRNFSNH